MLNAFCTQRGLLVLLLVVGLAACTTEEPTTPVPEASDQSSTQATPQAVTPTAETGALTQQAARDRYRRISKISYQLAIDLSETETQFSGDVEIAFSLRNASSGITLDFTDGAIGSVIANGKPIHPNYDGHGLLLPASALIEGENHLSISFTHHYRNDGNGLHRFVDPEDGRTYLYTYLWPYNANQLFPLFDQPNLKAHYDLTVKAPADWTVVSTGSGRFTVNEDGSRQWQFATTPRIPSYVFSLHAGPYRVWEDQAGDIPIRLFARQSLADYVAVDEWFEVTRNGLAYFGDYYAIPYPFEKYDQLIVPDFQIGAMENIAAVTFAEGFVQRQASSHAERESRAGVILHEMAHMWFGDLVTHHWWNGLWLNESFATQMAQMALVETTEFKDAWHRFYVNNKQAAYTKDSRVTTHPIEMPIAATDEFFSVFDAITYQKGSSVLKQLAHWVGEDNYRMGVSAYLKIFSYANTELADFIASISEAADLNLDDWSQQWLYQPGYNLVRSEYACDNGLLSELNLFQSAYGVGPSSRDHRVEIALYALDEENRLGLIEVFDASLSGEQSTPSIPEQTACPDLVFPNHNDWGYFRVELSDDERALVTAHLSEVEDPFARSMLLQVVHRATLSGETPFSDFLGLAQSMAADENNFRVLTQATNLLGSTIAMMERLQPETSAALAQNRPELEQLAWSSLAAGLEADVARMWFDFYLTIAGSEVALNQVRGLLDGHLELPGLTLSDDIRWRLLMVLARWGTEDIEDRLAQQASIDPSDFGQKMMIAAQAAKPGLESKQHWLEIVANPESEIGLARQRFAMGALLPPNQTELAEQVIPAALQAMDEFGVAVEPYFASNYAGSVLVPVCTQQSLDDYAGALENSERLSSTSLLFLREAQQDNEECWKLRETLRATDD